MSSSLCAAETKAASNCDGGRRVERQGDGGNRVEDKMRLSKDKRSLVVNCSLTLAGQVIRLSLDTLETLRTLPAWHCANVTRRVIDF